jgi:hypothetical protein
VHLTTWAPSPLTRLELARHRATIPAQAPKKGPPGGCDLDVRRRGFAGVFEAARDEGGAEMVEWIVVVAVRATVAAIVFGPNGILTNAMNNGVNHISNIITNAS